MKKPTFDFEIRVNTKQAKKKIEKAAISAERLKKALDELKDVEISYTITKIDKMWWQFWK